MEPADREEFLHDVLRENYLVMIITAALLAVSETFIYISFRGRLFDTDGVVLLFAVFNTVSLPILAFIYFKIERIGCRIAQAAQFINAMGVLVFCCALALIPQKEFESMHIYVIALFAIAAFLHLHPLHSLVLYLTGFIIFNAYLPLYQTNEQALLIMRINVTIMNIAAWGLGRLVFRMRLTRFLDKRTIIEQNRKLADMATRDPMTGLLNHETAYRKLCDEVVRSRRYGHPLTVMMLDIDNFKSVNDNHGHQAGDRVIRQVSEILRENCRRTDHAGRYGGEEFICILTDTDLPDSIALAERILKAVGSEDFDENIRVTVSIGLYGYEGEDADEMIGEADKLLYKAKSAGKNRIEAGAGVSAAVS